MMPTWTPAQKPDDMSAATLLILLGHLVNQSLLDGKTRLLTYGAWKARAEHALRSIRTGESRCAVLVIDIDHFRTVNSQHGHLGGDTILAAIAGVIQRAVRGRDLVARFGGDEFLVLLDSVSDRRSAWTVAERIRCRVHELAVTLDGPHGPYRAGGLSVSIGGALHAGSGDEHVMALTATADRALYAAKDAGRNTIRIHPTTASPHTGQPTVGQDPRWDGTTPDTRTAQAGNSSPHASQPHENDLHSSGGPGNSGNTVRRIRVPRNAAQTFPRKRITG